MQLLATDVMVLPLYTGIQFWFIWAVLNV